MAYDYLNHTTYENDDLANGNLAQLFSSMQPDESSDYEQVDPDLVEIAQGATQENSDEEKNEPDDKNEDESQEDFDFQNDSLDNNDMQLLSFLFNDKSNDSTEGAGGLINMKNTVESVANQVGDVSWLKTKSNAVNLSGLNPKISKYLNTLPDNLKNALIATSGNDQEHVNNSKHYSNNALDLRYNQEAYKYMQNDPKFKEMGLKMLDPNHGTAPHLHIETMKYGGIHIDPSHKGRFTEYLQRTGETTEQALHSDNPHVRQMANFARSAKKWHHGKAQDGGLFADTEEVQRIGLNNPGYNHAFFPLQGNNVIRGLDNNHPVAVTDGNKYKILVGNQDTATFKGNIYEKKL